MLNIFGRNTERATGGWRKRHKEDLHNFYSSKNIVTMIKSRRLRWARHTERKRNIFFGYVVKSERKRTLRRAKRKWEKNIKVNYKKQNGKR
jgi:hypothetical protein